MLTFTICYFLEKNEKKCIFAITRREFDAQVFNFFQLTAFAIVTALIYLLLRQLLSLFNKFNYK